MAKQLCIIFSPCCLLTYANFIVLLFVRQDLFATSTKHINLQLATAHNIQAPRLPRDDGSVGVALVALNPRRMVVTVKAAIENGRIIPSYPMSRSQLPSLTINADCVRFGNQRAPSWAKPGQPSCAIARIDAVAITKKGICSHKKMLVALCTAKLLFVV